MEQDLFVKRQSIRRFTPEAIPEETLAKLLQAAVEAPSAGNCQPWHFYVVKNPECKAQLSEASYGQVFIKDAPVVIVVCSEPLRSSQRYEERGESLYSIQDTAAAIENILLCAAANGLGSCWCGAFEEEAVSKILSLPDSRRPVAVVPIGFAAQQGKKRPRRPMEEVFTTVE